MVPDVVPFRSSSAEINKAQVL